MSAVFNVLNELERTGFLEVVSLGESHPVRTFLGAALSFLSGAGTLSEVASRLPAVETALAQHREAAADFGLEFDEHQPRDWRTAGQREIIALWLRGRQPSPTTDDDQDEDDTSAAQREPTSAEVRRPLEAVANDVDSRARPASARRGDDVEQRVRIDAPLPAAMEPNAHPRSIANDTLPLPDESVDGSPAGTDVARAVAEIDGWPEPARLVEASGPPFPVHTLSNWHQAFVEQLAEQVQVTMDAPALGSLAVIGAAAARAVTVVLQRGDEHPTNIWVQIVSRPGDGKTPLLQELRRPGVPRASADIDPPPITFMKPQSAS